MQVCGARFDWDDGNLAHIARHDVTAREVQEAIVDPHCLLESSEVRQAELRYNVTGQTADGRLLTIIFGVRLGAIRTVTSYTATKKKQLKYWARRKYVDQAPLP